MKTLLSAALSLAIGLAASSAFAQDASTAPPNPDVQTFGAGNEGFKLWARASFSAMGFRWQSAEEVWIALSDSYGPYPNKALAARAAAKYLEFDPVADRVTVVLFRSNQRAAEATVDREH